jgi:hypothetical protein
VFSSEEFTPRCFIEPAQARPGIPPDTIYVQMVAMLWLLLLCTQTVGNCSPRPYFGVGPRGPLVGEGEGIVIVEGIDDVGVGKRFEHQQVAEARPVRSAGDDGVLRRGRRMASTTVASMLCHR